MTKLEEYKQKFENIQTMLLDTQTTNQSEPLTDLTLLQTKLTFEIIDALRIISKQNKDNNGKITYIEKNIKEIMGEPIALLK